MRRISATGIEGFTLIELLVVVAITGIVLAVAAVNLWPSNEEIARRETGLLALSLEKARDAAWFGGRPTAVSFEPGAMHRWQLAADRSWRADAANDRALEGIDLGALYVDGQPMPTGQRLVFLADGFGTPFRMQLQVRGLERAIEGDAAGAITVVDK
jgi:general secretion pathway protein H